MGHCEAEIPMERHLHIQMTPATEVASSSERLGHFWLYHARASESAGGPPFGPMMRQERPRGDLERQLAHERGAVRRVERHALEADDPALIPHGVRQPLLVRDQVGRRDVARICAAQIQELKR